MNAEKIGRIIWHDLFSSDRDGSMEFYRRVAGWHYETEHATDFAWGGGEKDFILALLDDEAGAGIAQTPEAFPNSWIAYVEVADVDASCSQAEKLGGTIVRKPFEVPGVGRNALVIDPAGALIGLALSRHNYPAPTRQFGPEIYLSGQSEFPAGFYFELFDWTLAPQSDGTDGDRRVIGPSSTEIARYVLEGSEKAQSVWLPGVRVADAQSAAREAKLQGAHLFGDRPSKGSESNLLLMRDPDGASIYLVEI
ncbi:VOC family protein [uncultured Parasphingorhabdus sp.]|uniref:VOC family protein n=1 Tax=uncultured Parasphingorhabdus sp. TaxID=2709694 RepID=UPI0030DDCBFB|tara:strand:+ start:5572 stop:6327 length:756 start_codon:yes stop_codon:yes gene_type:complete